MMKLLRGLIMVSMLICLIGLSTGAIYADDLGGGATPMGTGPGMPPGPLR